MKSENLALKRLLNKSSKVSCHYFIKNNGSILNLVPDEYVSWHAGISSWKELKKLTNIQLELKFIILDIGMVIKLLTKNN